jgi:hypothetical protein
MATIYRFKRYENRVVKTGKKLGRMLGEKTAALFKGLSRALKRSYTRVV